MVQRKLRNSSAQERDAKFYFLSSLILSVCLTHLYGADHLPLLLPEAPVALFFKNDFIYNDTARSRDREVISKIFQKKSCLHKANVSSIQVLQYSSARNEGMSFRGLTNRDRPDSECKIHQLPGQTFFLVRRRVMAGLTRSWLSSMTYPMLSMLGRCGST